MSELTPREIVHELDKHIIGQNAAKRAVAIALRNRWRRMRVDEALRAEITPKNILMIGPTGVGKTEIARRLAKLSQAPFIKVEATKYTEVGYVGRDVESMVRDLVDVAIKMVREAEIHKVEQRAEDQAEKRVLDALLPTKSSSWEEDVEEVESSTRAKMRKKLRAGELHDREIELEVNSASIGVEIMAPPGMEEMTSQLQNIFQSLGGSKTKMKKMTVREALSRLKEEEAEKLVNEDEIKSGAITSVEENGIIFIDEIDKVARRASELSGQDVSREGVQRDLLPLIEGCTVNTKYGMVKTDHILFIASGAFHLAKPSDLIPEMQGRLPIRVELNALEIDDFVRILTEPDASLTQQYTALLATEGINLNFTPDGVTRLAEIAWHINSTTENIGARRLHTVMERLLEDISFSAADCDEKDIVIDAGCVDKALNDLSKDEDLSRYIL